MTRAEAMRDVDRATLDARDQHRKFASWHEAYAVILEELEEFWDSVKRDDADTDELAQVVACCLLAMVELDGTDTDGNPQ